MCVTLLVHSFYIRNQGKNEAHFAGEALYRAKWLNRNPTEK